MRVCDLPGLSDSSVPVGLKAWTDNVRLVRIVEVRKVIVSQVLTPATPNQSSVVKVRV